MLVVATLAGTLLITLGAHAAGSGLIAGGCIDDNDTGPDACAESIDGLGGPESVAVSPDGRSVYVASAGNDALVRLDRDPATGALTPAGCIENDESETDGCAASADGLRVPVSVAVSPDGRSVYVASLGDEAITSLDRDPTTGALTPAGCIDDDDTAPDTCAASTDGLRESTAVAVSPDGRSVYATSFIDDAIVTFDRNTANGALNPVGCIEDQNAPDECETATEGLAGGTGVVVSPDGQSVHVASAADTAVVSFKRDTSTGALTPAGCVADHDTGPRGCGAKTPGLTIAGSVAISPDGRSVYVASGLFDDAIVSFDRDASTGALRPAGCIDDNDGDTELYSGEDDCAASTDGLDGAEQAIVSPDGHRVYAVTGGDDAIVSFDRDAATGLLTPAGCIDDNDTGPEACGASTDGLEGGYSIAASPDGSSVYAVSFIDHAITRFAQAPFVDPGPTPKTGAGAGAALSPGDVDPANTEITKSPRRRTHKRKAKLAFDSDESGSTFECRLDKRGFKPCETPVKKRVRRNRKHTFRVRAIDAAGNVDPSPAKRRWKVLD